MYLHIGGGKELQLKDVIAVSRYDADNVLLLKNKKAGRLQNEGMAAPKSVIFTDKGIWFSDIEPLTLKKRAEGSIAAMKKEKSFIKGQ
jgi:hypothetical protein